LDAGCASEKVSKAVSASIFFLFPLALLVAFLPLLVYAGDLYGSSPDSSQGSMSGSIVLTAALKLKGIKTVIPVHASEGVTSGGVGSKAGLVLGNCKKASLESMSLVNSGSDELKVFSDYLLELTVDFSEGSRSVQCVYDTNLFGHLSYLSSGKARTLESTKQVDGEAISQTSSAPSSASAQGFLEGAQVKITCTPSSGAQGTYFLARSSSASSEAYYVDAVGRRVSSSTKQKIDAGLASKPKSCTMTVLTAGGSSSQPVSADWPPGFEIDWPPGFEIKIPFNTLSPKGESDLECFNQPFESWFVSVEGGSSGGLDVNVGGRVLDDFGALNDEGVQTEVDGFEIQPASAFVSVARNEYKRLGQVDLCAGDVVSWGGYDFKATSFSPDGVQLSVYKTPSSSESSEPPSEEQAQSEAPTPSEGQTPSGTQNPPGGQLPSGEGGESLDTIFLSSSQKTDYFELIDLELKRVKQVSPRFPSMLLATVKFSSRETRAAAAGGVSGGTSAAGGETSGGSAAADGSQTGAPVASKEGVELRCRETISVPCSFVLPFGSPCPRGFVTKSATDCFGPFYRRAECTREYSVCSANPSCDEGYEIALRKTCTLPRS
jgi:hypothetical protein